MWWVYQFLIPKTTWFLEQRAEICFCSTAWPPQNHTWKRIQLQLSFKVISLCFHHKVVRCISDSMGIFVCLLASCFFVSFWLTPSFAHHWFLALCSGITRGSAQFSICRARGRTHVGCVQGKCLTRCSISTCLVFLLLWKVNQHPV